MEAGQGLISKRLKSAERILEARVGFEPTNGGFADLSLGPLGYRAKLLSIAKILPRLGNWRHTTRGLRAIFLQAQEARRFWLRARNGPILRAALD
jgi:hypothetical protein